MPPLRCVQFLAALLLLSTTNLLLYTQTQEAAPSGRPNSTIEYKNAQYDFCFSLPASWKNYSIVTDQWTGYNPGDPHPEKSGHQGPIISIRHPQWTKENPRQDIPIMVFTRKQWESLLKDEFHIGAAPIGPSELGRNHKYVFALPARFDYAYPTGFEEVEQIVRNNPLQAPCKEK